MPRLPRIGGPSFFARLRDDTRTLADAAGIPQNAAEMVKSGVKVGAKVFACLVAAHELQTHAGRLLGQAAGEVSVFEREELDEVKAQEWQSGYDIGARNGVCVAWLAASQHAGFRVPGWVLADIQRLGEAGQWYQPPVVAHPVVPGQRPAEADSDQAVSDVAGDGQGPADGG